MAKAYPMLNRKSCLGSEIEAVAGTPQAVTVALPGTAVYNAEIVPDETLVDDRTPDSASGGTRTGVPGKTPGTLTFRTELTAGDATDLLLPACGFGVAGAVFTVTNDLSVHNTRSFTHWHDGKRTGLYGAVGSFKLTVAAGMPVYLDWTWKGIFLNLADAAQPADSFPTALPVVGATSLQIASADVPHWSQFALDVGNDCQERENASATGGVAHWLVVDRKPVISIDPEARLAATLDHYAALYAATEQALACVLSRGAASLTIAAPKTQRRKVAPGARRGQRIESLDLKCNINSANDELVFTFAGW